MSSVLFILLMLQNGPAVYEPVRNLPELDAFLRSVRAHLRSDRLLQSQYTFNLKQTEIWLDKKGNQKKTEVDEYEVFPSLDEKYTYMRHISKDGRPLSSDEIEKQDREQDKKLSKREQKLKQDGTDEIARRLRAEAEEKRKEDLIIDEIFRLYDISMVGREVMDGYSAIQLSFQPRTSYKPINRETRILAKVAGRAWFCEEDQQLMRLEVELVDNLSFGMGILARLNKGARGVLLRRRINNEIWLPAEARFSGTAKLLLLKGIRINTVSEFSDYKKFTVETSVKYRVGRNP